MVRQAIVPYLHLLLKNPLLCHPTTYNSTDITALKTSRTFASHQRKCLTHQRKLLARQRNLLAHPMQHQDSSLHQPNRLLDNYPNKNNPNNMDNLLHRIPIRIPHPPPNPVKTSYQTPKTAPEHSDRRSRTNLETCRTAVAHASLVRKNSFPSRVSHFEPDEKKYELSPPVSATRAFGLVPPPWAKHTRETYLSRIHLWRWDVVYFMEFVPLRH
jgi:hypothetical protein